MLETFPQLHQGLGLHGQPGAAAPSSLRVLAMLRDTAADPEGQSEQSLLWPVCASLQRLGMPVLVLDASCGSKAPGRPVPACTPTPVTARWPCCLPARAWSCCPCRHGKPA